MQLTSGKLLNYSRLTLRQCVFGRERMIYIENGLIMAVYIVHMVAIGIKGDAFQDKMA